MIPLISEYHGAAVIWVDDRVGLTTENITHILQTDRSRTQAELQPLNQAWVTAVLEDLGHTLPTESEKNFAAAARVFMTVCNAHRLNLYLANFRDASASAMSSSLLLLDLQNATKALGTTEYDSRWGDWSFYGAEFIKHFKIPKHRFRFVTRYRSSAADPVKAILTDYFVEDTDVFAHSLRLEDLTALRSNFDSFVKTNTLHPAPCLNEAVCFATSSNAKKPWEHNSLESGDQNAAIAKWLGLRNVDGNSAKALLLGLSKSGASPWKVTDSSDAYPIKLEVLASVCRKLGVSMTTDSKDNYRLPTQPGLPFLMSLCALLCQMNRDKRFFPPSVVNLSRTNGEHILRISLCEKDKNGDVINMKDFEDAFIRQCEARKASMTVSGNSKRDPEVGAHLVTARLADLQQAQVCSRNIDGDQDKFCSGTYQNAVTIGFNKDAFTIEIAWKTKNV